MSDEWMEVFRAGTHTAMNGTTRTWTLEDLDHAVAAYDPAQHEAPLVVGHPKDNDPAYGWVAQAKREGDRLLVKSKQVDPAFQEMVKAGRFKKRSISFYADGTIRHIGFLGAQPPAVKGLKDCHFAQGDEGLTYEEAQEDPTWGQRMLKLLREASAWGQPVIRSSVAFEEEPAAETPAGPIEAIMQCEEAMSVLERIKWISSDETYRIKNDEEMAPDEKKAQLRALFDELRGLIDQHGESLINSFAERSEEMADSKVGAISMTPEQLEEFGKKAAKAAVAEFAEKHTDLEKKVGENFASLQAKARAEQITAFCERLQEKGVAPALVKDSGLAAILKQCDAVEEHAFAEGKDKQTLAGAVEAVILAFAEAAKKGTLLVDFSERGKGGRSSDQQDLKAQALAEYAENQAEYDQMGVSAEDLEKTAKALQAR